MNRTFLQQSTFSLVLVVLALLVPNEGIAQAPDGINFQAVARNAGGIPYAVIPINVRLRILDGTSAVVYQESHGVTTDIFGLFDVVLGQGTVIGGSFAGISWEAGPYTVEIDVDDGGGFVFVGSCQFQSVPYALYADKANMAVGDLTDVDLTGLAPGQTLIWDGTNWLPGAAASTIWSQNATSAYYNTGRVGIGMSDPDVTLHVADTANVLVGDSLSGSGFKMIYYGAKGAFRSGYLSNPFGGYNYDKFWDYDSVGYYSFAAGQNSRAKGFGSFAFGAFGWADGSGSVAFFGNARGNGSFTFGGSSIGRGSVTFEGTAQEEGGIAMYGYTGGRYGVAIGGGTLGLGAASSREDYAVAIGWNADARGQASVALGPNDAYGYNSFSTGWVTEARGNYSSTFGYRTNSFPYAAMALGRFNVITGDSAAWVATDPVFMIGDGTAAAARSNSFIIQKNGQTAIGYDAPVGMLQVSSALGSLNNGGALDVTNASLLLGTTATGLALDPNQIESIGSALHHNYNSAEDITLAVGGGSVAVGHTAPTDRFHIAALAGEDAMRVQINGVTRFRVHANGGVSIGINQGPPAEGLVINGITQPAADNAFTMGSAARRWTTIYATNGVINTSDARLKTNIQPLRYGLNEVLAMQPVNFDWIEGGEAKIGFLAQDLETIIPEVVFRPANPDEYLGVNYPDLIPVLVSAIQEQQETITTQEERLAQQEKELADIRAELDAIKTMLTNQSSQP